MPIRRILALAAIASLIVPLVAFGATVTKKVYPSVTVLTNVDGAGGIALAAPLNAVTFPASTAYYSDAKKILLTDTQYFDPSTGTLQGDGSVNFVVSSGVSVQLGPDGIVHIVGGALDGITIARTGTIFDVFGNPITYNAGTKTFTDSSGTVVNFGSQPTFSLTATHITATVSGDVSSILSPSGTGTTGAGTQDQQLQQLQQQIAQQQAALQQQALQLQQQQQSLQQAGLIPGRGGYGGGGYPGQQGGLGGLIQSLAPLLSSLFGNNQQNRPQVASNQQKPSTGSTQGCSTCGQNGQLPKLPADTSNSAAPLTDAQRLASIKQSQSLSDQLGYDVADKGVTIGTRASGATYTTYKDGSTVENIYDTNTGKLIASNHYDASDQVVNSQTGNASSGSQSGGQGLSTSYGNETYGDHIYSVLSKTDGTGVYTPAEIDQLQALAYKDRQDGGLNQQDEATFINLNKKYVQSLLGPGGVDGSTFPNQQINPGSMNSLPDPINFRTLPAGVLNNKVDPTQFAGNEVVATQQVASDGVIIPKGTSILVDESINGNQPSTVFVNNVAYEMKGGAWTPVGVTPSYKAGANGETGPDGTPGSQGTNATDATSWWDDFGGAPLPGLSPTGVTPQTDQEWAQLQNDAASFQVQQDYTTDYGGTSYGSNANPSWWDTIGVGGYANDINSINYLDQSNVDVPLPDYNSGNSQYMLNNNQSYYGGYDAGSGYGGGNDYCDPTFGC